MAAIASNRVLSCRVCLLAAAGLGLVLGLRPENDAFVQPTRQDKDDNPIVTNKDGKEEDWDDTNFGDNYFPPRNKKERIQVYKDAAEKDGIRLHGDQTNVDPSVDKVDRDELWLRWHQMNDDPQKAEGANGNWFHGALSQEQELKWAVDNIQQAARYMSYVSQKLYEKLYHQEKVMGYTAKRVNEVRTAEQETLPAAIKTEISAWDKMRLTPLEEPIVGLGIGHATNFYEELVNGENKIKPRSVEEIDKDYKEKRGKTTLPEEQEYLSDSKLDKAHMAYIEDVQKKLAEQHPNDRPPV